MNNLFYVLVEHIIFSFEIQIGNCLLVDITWDFFYYKVVQLYRVSPTYILNIYTNVRQKLFQLAKKHTKNM